MNEKYIVRGMTIGGEWVYGYYAQVGHGLGQSGISEEYGDVKSVIIVTKNKQSSLYSNANPCEVTITEMVEVIPETVGLWTTLKDKNGKLIFWGDLLKDKNGQIFTYKELEQDKQLFCFWQNVKFASCFPQDGYKLGYSDQLEVIGNIHENTELLGGK